jgi:Uma2 family endonuclease
MSVEIDTKGAFRAEDLLRPGMPEKFSEIVEGELIVREPAGRYHNRIAFKFQFLFHDFAKAHPELDYGGDNEGFLVQRNPDTMLSPDACLFRRRDETGSSTWMEFAPEVAVEVLSPSNTRAEIAYKRRKYFLAGSEQVWIVDPQTQTIEFCFSDSARIIVQGDEMVRGRDIVEGLEITLSEIFKRP